MKRSFATLNFQICGRNSMLISVKSNFPYNFCWHLILHIELSAYLVSYSDLRFSCKKKIEFSCDFSDRWLGVKAKNSNKTLFPALSNQICSIKENNLFSLEIKCRNFEFWETEAHPLGIHDIVSFELPRVDSFVMFWLWVQSSHRYTYHVHSAKTPFAILLPSRHWIDMLLFAFSANLLHSQIFYLFIQFLGLSTTHQLKGYILLRTSRISLGTYISKSPNRALGNNPFTALEGKEK